MVRYVVQEGDEILRRKCREVRKFDDSLAGLLSDMKDTVRSEEGAGLAAPQIGVDLRAVVLDVDEGFIEMVNPVIVHEKGMQVGAEGCLSLKGLQGTVARPQSVKVEFRDRRGRKHTMTCEGFTARAVCHEVDHLDGKLYTDIAIEVYEIDENGDRIGGPEESAAAPAETVGEPGGEEASETATEET